MQKLVTKGTYFVTITPKYRLRSPMELYYSDMRMIRVKLNKFSDHYCLYPEFSVTSRLHYHGIIKIKDLIKFHRIKYQIDRDIGFSKFDKLKTKKDLFCTLIYSMKEWPMTREYLKQPIMYKKLRRVNKAKEEQIKYLDEGIIGIIHKLVEQDNKRPTYGKIKEKALEELFQ